ncbi:MAG: phytanoyl-CoA dioxygenase family protein [Saprospiraceae bacterium]|nr:phytanoyl-CoA dioxygenase family protein [Saprospiraceae bacterium]
MPIPSKISSLLSNDYALSDSQIAFYKENRFIKLKQVFNEETIDFFNNIISEKVNNLTSTASAKEERSTYEKAFLQLFNLWRENDLIKELIFSRRLAKIASELMETDGVRIYHDQALFKKAGGGITPWHADQYYWPLATDKTITAWIPLQTTPLELGPLEFSAGSHQIMEGRALEISDESEFIIKQNLKLTNLKHVIEPFDCGEISFHSGWVFHRAGPNITDQTRKVMTIIYMDKDMKLKQPENKNQLNDWNTWCPGANVGELINTKLNPILFQKMNLKCTLI